MSNSLATVLRGARGKGQMSREGVWGVFQLASLARGTPAGRSKTVHQLAVGLMCTILTNGGRGPWTKPWKELGGEGERGRESVEFGSGAR